MPAGSSAGVCCKACAGRIVRRLCFCFKACAGQFICRLFVCLQRPCSAGCVACPPLPCHTCCPHHFCPVLFCIVPLFIAMCARITAKVARTALLAATTRACSAGPCTVLRPSIHPSIHPSISCVHCVCHLSWHGDCVCAAHAPLCSLRPCKKGEVLDCV